MKQPRTFRELAKIIASRRKKPLAPIRSGYSTGRRVTVEDVFWGAGKHRKSDGKWIEAPVLIIGSGHGQRIYPRKSVHKEPNLDSPREFLWVTTLYFGGRMTHKLRKISDVLKSLNLNGVRKVSFHLGKDEGIFCRIEKDLNDWKWTYEYNTRM
jgi:hypothetical protein